MVFNRKGSFFLNLGGDEPKQPVAVAPQAPVASPEAAPSADPAAAEPPAAVEVPPEVEAAPALTTAEAIAAELRRDQENRPAPSTVTFAPEQLSPSGALPRPRRRAGANLAGFKATASSLIQG
jgi:hypothetical protein